MNEIYLFNSISKKRELFKPISDTVKIYSCGPTVYNNLHIGNLAAFIYSDLIRRSLEVNGLNVEHVMNITDVDDKTIRDSKRDYPNEDPKTALKMLTDKYAEVFKQDLAKTGNDISALKLISAVETIPEMVKMIQKLLDNKVAYVADDGVYFSITKYYQAGHKYGILQNVETQQSKARILNDEYDKDSASDFALWKKSGEGDPSWQASFSEDLMVTDMPGHPGWHIECSTMIDSTLGTPIDIHTGGIDLKFPHHENEIAQNVGAGSESLANYFVHTNHVLVDGKKMSKSLNNFFTLRDIEEKGYDAQTFRLLVLSSHYHSESIFSWDILESAKNRLSNWRSISELIWQLDQDQKDIRAEIKQALADNLNTPQAMKIIDLYFDHLVQTNKSPNKSNLEFIKKSLGIDLSSEDISDDQKKLIDLRSKARQDKDWNSSDKLRDEILKQGLRIRDEASQQIWSRAR